MDTSPSHRSRRDSRQASRDRRSPLEASPRPSGGLPPPNTYSQYKRRNGQNGYRNGGEKTHGGTSGGIVQQAGESGRRGFHPLKFLTISFRSASRASLVCNVLWPVVPAAIAVRCKLSLHPVQRGCDAHVLLSDALPDKHILIFTLAYIAMVPCANLVGFAGQELARKFPHVIGVLAEITYVQQRFALDTTCC